jgi:hypothetical protein
MKLKINNPCPEIWEDMQDSPEGKFCEKCAKCVVNFNDKTENEIRTIFKDANGKEVCGRISSSLLKLASSLVLVTNLTFINAQTKDIKTHPTEQAISNVMQISGQLLYKKNKKEIADAEVFFICRKKYFKTTTDRKGNFTLDIPTEFLKKKNVLYFNFDKINEIMRSQPGKRSFEDLMSYNTFENKTIIFLERDSFSNKEFIIESEKSYIGGASIMQEYPPDYYYFNGKSVSEWKFEKIRKENPNYQFFIFEGKEAEILAQKNYLDTVRLLYSE